MEEIYRVLGQLQIALMRVDTKLDSFNEALMQLRNEHRNSHGDHETRIRKLEGDHVPLERFTRLETRPHISPASARWFVGTLIALAGLILALINMAK